MTAKEIRNKIADPDGPFRKWGTFWGSLLGATIFTVYNLFHTPATKQDAEVVKQSQDSAMIYLKDIKGAVTDLQRDAKLTDSRIRLLEYSDEVQWKSLKRNDINKP